MIQAFALHKRHSTNGPTVPTDPIVRMRCRVRRGGAWFTEEANGFYLTDWPHHIMTSAHTFGAEAGVPNEVRWIDVSSRASTPQLWSACGVALVRAWKATDLAAVACGSKGPGFNQSFKPGQRPTGKFMGKLIYLDPNRHLQWLEVETWWNGRWFQYAHPAGTGGVSGAPLLHGPFVVGIHTGEVWDGTQKKWIHAAQALTGKATVSCRHWAKKACEQGGN